MLVELRIRNIAVIDFVALPLAPALNVLTGETGAGKSLIVGALGLLLGDRAGGDRLRAGAERGSVEGIFEIGARLGPRQAVWDLLDARGLESEDGLVVLKRELASGGRSRAWINGTPVTIAVLSEVGARLVNVHGQHEAQHLLQSDVQREVLDQFSNARETAHAVGTFYAKLVSLELRAAARASQRRDVERRADYLRFVVAEISAAQPVPEEGETLDAEIRLLSNAQEIRELSAHVSEALEGEDVATVAGLQSVRRSLASLARFTDVADKWLATIDEVSVTIDELARDVAGFGEGIEANPARLRTLESRRDLLHQLSRKYGPAITDVLATWQSAQAELELVDGGAGDAEAMQMEIASVRSEVLNAAKQLTTLRNAGARKLGLAVSALLPELGMIDGHFSVALETASAVGANGAEQVSFQVALNGGGEMRPLSRIASGGELARIMLALSTVLARLQDVPTLVFDEVDAGVGGIVAWQVGALMRKVASHHQVLAISHLAQIASRAHHHVVVQKAGVGGVTSADTTVATADARVMEIARMLGGDAEREVSRAHARELLDRGARDEAAFPFASDTREASGVMNAAVKDVNGKALNKPTAVLTPNASGAVTAPAAGQRRGKRV